MRALFLADRLARPAMWLVAGLHLLFLASFLWIAMTVAAHAQTACTGKDLLADLRRTDPQRLAKIEEKAARTENGDAILWRISKEGVEISWLFGTIHMTDPRVTTLTSAASDAFDKSNTIVIETKDVIDEKRTLGDLAKKPELMMYIGQDKLTDDLSPEDIAILTEGLKARGIAIGTVIKMKPWMLMAAVAMPACEMARKASGEKILDVQLAMDGEDAGKDVIGLETGIEQVEALASLPMSFHMQGLIDTLKLGDQADDMIETMIAIYLEGRTNLIWPLFQDVLGDGASFGEGYAEFEKTIIVKRNHTMAERVAPILKRGGAFVAVGALHLPGDEGLVTLLRNQGYTVEPVVN